MSRRPDAVVSSSSFVKSEPTDNRHAIPPPAPESTHIHDDDDDPNDPIVRTIDVFISPALTNSLHLLQFPIQPVIRENVSKRDQSNTPSEAKFRPKHNMLELDYPIPSSAQAGNRQLTDKMCLSTRTFSSNAVAPVTHMALAKFNRDGTRLNVVPMQKHVFQMRPSFGHLHDEEDEDPTTTVAAAEEKLESTKSGGRQKPIMYQKKETERSINARRNSYAYFRANQESEEWIELDVHGIDGKWSMVKKEIMYEIKCKNRENELKCAKNPKSLDADGGYVKSLNYLDSYSAGRSSGETFVENLSDWAPSAAVSVVPENSTDGDDLVMGEEGDDDVNMADEVPSSTTPVIGATEQATAELASKLAILLQTGNGTMIPYRVVRSRFLVAKVSDEMLTTALSSCAVLVRGNFSLKSNLAKFLSTSGSGEGKRKLMRELRDLILLLLNMHGMVQRERLTSAYSAKAEKSMGYGAINVDAITFVLQTVAKKSDDCWVAKVEDDEEFAAKFPKVAACHGIYWIKKKDRLADLIELYESAEADDAGDEEW